MPEITLEDRVAIVRVGEFIDLVPATIWDSAQLMNARRTEQNEIMRDMLRETDFLTYNSALYDVENAQGVRDLEHGEPVVYLGNGTLMFDNFHDATTQMFTQNQNGLNGYYFPDDKTANIFKKAKDTLRFTFSELYFGYVLRKKRWPHSVSLPIFTDMYEQKLLPGQRPTKATIRLNQEQRQAAEWAYGNGEDFHEAMKMLNDNGLDRTKLLFLSPESVIYEVTREGKAIAQFCVLSNFENFSSFRADYSIGARDQGYLLRGTLNEEGVRIFQEQQTGRVQSAYEVLMSLPCTSIEVARSDPKYAAFVHDISSACKKSRVKR